ncbi:hypothetical protein EVA_20885 [gut metagenome]|uniref:Uncharacterized protein n=1 Tax=gut metagenome TaxID=749906 RepID=J9F9A1_9ZZZZ
MHFLRKMPKEVVMTLDISWTYLAMVLLKRAKILVKLGLS